MVFAFVTFNIAWCRGSLSFILNLDAKVVVGENWLAFLAVWLMIIFDVSSIIQISGRFIIGLLLVLLKSVILRWFCQVGR